MPDPLCLFIEVPICAFRPNASREYQDTFPVPAPSSVYGMLLSFIGVPREEKARYRGAAIALAVETLPIRSKVFRKLRRGKDLENTRPDYQDTLSDLKLWVWLGCGKDIADPCLVDRVRTGLADPSTITRFGGLSLGESSYLVDTVSAETPNEPLHFLVPDPSGFFSLPVWVDHADSRNTIARRFRIDDCPQPVATGLPVAWFCIGQPT